MDLLNLKIDINTLDKKGIEKISKEIVNDFLEKGEENEINKFSEVVRISNLLQAIEKEFRSHFEKMSNFSAISVGNMKIEPQEGRKSLNYNEDPIYADLLKQLKEREALLKNAQNSVIYDENGVEIPKVSVSFSKSSIKISY